MIRLVNALPEVSKPTAEYIRIKCLFDCYNEDPDTYFWQQTGEETYICFSDGNMTVSYGGGDTEELAEFIKMLSPRTLFTDSATFEKLVIQPAETVEVMGLYIDTPPLSDMGDRLSSKDIYGIFASAELDVPDYPHFAVDFCRRLNRGGASFWGIKNKCAAVSFNTGKYSLLCGLASLEKGKGGQALKAIICKNSGRQMLLCCKPPLVGFYEKYGFKRLYTAGYKVRE